jgi:hypothetical protein
VENFGALMLNGDQAQVGTAIFQRVVLVLKETMRMCLVFAEYLVLQKKCRM